MDVNRAAEVFPAYGKNTLADVLAPVAAHLGYTDIPQSTVQIPEAEQYVLVLVDGLGETLLEARLDEAPFLGGLWPGHQQLTACFPSTTATSLTSLYTGTPPGRHGIVGYSFRWAPGRLLNALSWADGPADPRSFQSESTWFQRLSEAGIPVWFVTLAQFANSGLTQAAMRGGNLITFDDELNYAARATQVAELATANPGGLIVVYERKLDHAGHGYGTTSPQWLKALGRIDGFLGALREQLPQQTRILITGDHGMVNIAPAHRILIEDEPDLAAGLDILGGEPRLRQLYTADPEGLAARWAKVLGQRAWVLLRDEAIDRGLFGPTVTPVNAERIGDVIAVLADDWIVATTRHPGELKMIGQHGSMSRAEMLIPLLIS
jgi:predicted AlkP superfamily pyrophosphatase or phosphodiesterase